MFKNLARAAALAAAPRCSPSRPHSPAAGTTPPPLKVGFVYVSPIGEAGWTYQHDQGRQAMEQALGDQVQTHRRRGGAPKAPMPSA